MFDVARDSDNHQTTTQKWEVIVTASKTVFIGFEQNCFRKHFLLPSKKMPVPTTSEQKAKNRAATRFMATGFALKLDPTIKPSNAEQKAIKLRYGMGAVASHLVNLNLLSLKEVLVELATALIHHDWASDVVTIQFSKPCVVRAGAGAEPGDTSVVAAVGEPESTIKFQVRKNDENSYTLLHAPQQ